MNRTKIQAALAFLLTVSLSLAVLPVAAQDTEPTDRPFPGQAAVTATLPAEPTDRPFPGQAAATATLPAEPTNRPFPGQAEAAATTETTEQPSAAEETQAAIPVGEDETATITPDEALATATAAEQQLTELQAEIGRLNTELEAAQSDTGATTFALVIIIVGVVLALGVFFGLRRSGS